MVSPLQEHNSGVLDFIHDPVFLSDSPRENTSAQVLQGFGFADALKWIAHNSIHQLQDSKRSLSIRLNPEG
jgi:hypothetical protein